ncbi:hypothetical protein Ahy_A09g042696 [Arachis hypogaea]|uniref:PB1-like domain-containing protein n=1 Tax=Arachis hypogaea TaxID=3818 RepID=A0A445BGJ4_ARAHY|nr:hypothetical protein Ahy_A09g042696 [Arachis hypogaea]
MATIHITLRINHRGRFERGPCGKLSYVGGEVTEIERVNVDTLNGFFVSDLVKNIGYTFVTNFFWLEPGKELDDGLRDLKVDMDIVRMYEAVVKNSNRINVYTEHPVNEPVLVEENNMTPSKMRVKRCARRVPTPKKSPKRRLIVVENEDDAEIVSNLQVGMEDQKRSEAQSKEETYEAHKQASLEAQKEDNISMAQETADPQLSGSVEAGHVSQPPPTPVIPDLPPSTQSQPSQPPIEQDQQPTQTALQQPHPMPPPTGCTATATSNKCNNQKTAGQRQQPSTPPANQPTTTPSTHNSQTTPHPLQGASAGTSTRFMQFMPTPGVVTPTATGRGTSDRGRGQGRGRGRIRGASRGKNGLSSGSKSFQIAATNSNINKDYQFYKSYDFITKYISQNRQNATPSATIFPLHSESIHHQALHNNARTFSWLNILPCPPILVRVHPPKQKIIVSPQQQQQLSLTAHRGHMMNYLLGFVIVPDSINTTFLPQKHLPSSFFSFIFFELKELLRVPKLAFELNLRDDIAGVLRSLWIWSYGSNWGRELARVFISTITYIYKRSDPRGLAFWRATLDATYPKQVPTQARLFLLHGAHLSWLQSQFPSTMGTFISVLNSHGYKWSIILEYSLNVSEYRIDLPPASTVLNHLNQRGVHGSGETGFDVIQVDPKYVPGPFLRPELDPRPDETYTLSGYNYIG